GGDELLPPARTGGCGAVAGAVPGPPPVRHRRGVRRLEQGAGRALRRRRHLRPDLPAMRRAASKRAAVTAALAAALATCLAVRAAAAEDARVEAGPKGFSLASADGHWTLERSEEHTSELQSRENLVCRP